uniref:Uncharacterized protein n=1 Tax=Oryza sativa subsp. japonica TaxID=39947 RepID=Q653V1_ORYSJ|nr:hypothetical protein [Oryza sativa Japonica Group]BAD45916.1 hypothetical protein [Oryza sativa Japonica Group]
MARVQQQQQHYATFNNNQINYHTPYALAQDAAGQRMGIASSIDRSINKFKTNL